MELIVIYEHEEMRDMVVHVNSEGLQKIMTILADENNIIVTQLTQRPPDVASHPCLTCPLYGDEEMCINCGAYATQPRR